MVARQADLARGTVVAGRYEVLAKLGGGAFSNVYRVRDRLLGTDCALKVLQCWEQVALQPLERLKRELLLGRKVADPLCCRLFDLAEADGTLFLTMELVAGWTLEMLLARFRPLPVAAALNLALQATAAVEALHRQGIVHRDVKPSNLMVQPDAGVKLMDLGFSWSAEVASLTATGALLGTPTHMAPEYLLGGQFSACTDVYALGVLAYELLTGRLPLQGKSLRAQAQLVLATSPPPLRSLRPELGASVEALVLRCLSKEPVKRPADAGALKQEWLAALGGWPGRDALHPLLATLELPEAVSVPAGRGADPDATPTVALDAAGRAGARHDGDEEEEEEEEDEPTKLVPGT